MKKLLLILLLLIVFALAYVWYSVQGLPTEASDLENQQEQLVERLADDISRQGVGAFLGGKLTHLLNGELVLTENEFNALLLASLRGHRDGRNLLAISDAVVARIVDSELEVGATVDLTRLAEIDPSAKDDIEKVSQALPLLSESRLYLGVRGQPTARNGELAVGDGLKIRLGQLSLPAVWLNQFGLDASDVYAQSLPLKYMHLKSVNVQDKRIVLSVNPRF